jgi:deoxyribonuclease V
VAAGLWFTDWPDSASGMERVLPVERVEPYQPGQFFRRELPCLLAVLATGPAAEIIVVDGYVWLEDESHPGLGAHLHRALDQKAAVIGVAKTSYRGSQLVREVRRGGSQNPLYITAAGIDLVTAADHISRMHGPYRIPTLLKRVDQLCRGGGIS